jgi:hypothetical protein
MVTTTGGEFYVGETVYLYRDASFTYSDRIGRHPHLLGQTQYDADGTVSRCTSRWATRSSAVSSCMRRSVPRRRM